MYNLNGVPQSKAGLVPWNFIDCEYSKANAESMYNNNYISSGLITGTQWDVMLKNMVGKTVGETTEKEKIKLTEANLTNSGIWGNYIDNSIEYNGRLAKIDYNSSNLNAWTLKPFGIKSMGMTTKYSIHNGNLLTTAASKITQIYHIYDVAGNVWEWTEENSNYSTADQYNVLRGGCFINNCVEYPVCYRFGTWKNENGTSPFVGFRVVLYIK